MKSNFSILLSHYIKTKKLPATQLSKRLKKEFDKDISRNAISAWRNGQYIPSRNNRGVLLDLATCFALSKQETLEFIEAAGFKITDFPKKNITAFPTTIMRLTTRPITDPNQFFGREAILAKMSSAWKEIPLEHIAIYGKKRSGKTSLLNYIRHHTKWQGYNWVFIDFGNPLMRTLKNLVCYVLEEIKLKISQPKCYLSDFLEIIEDQLKMPTVIFMENIDRGLQSRDLSGFWDTLRHLSTSNNYVGFCFTSCIPLIELEKTLKISEHSSHFINIFSESKLGPLTKEEAHKMLSSAPLSEQDVQWVLKLLGHQQRYWPILLQELIWARLDNNHQNWKQAAAEAIERYGFLLKFNNDT